MRGFVDPDPHTVREWVVDRNDVRTIYQADTGQKRVEWTTAGHRTIKAAVPFLRQIAGSSGNLNAAQLSNAVRLLAEVQVSLISVALRQDNPDDDPLVSASGGGG